MLGKLVWVPYEGHHWPAQIVPYVFSTVRPIINKSRPDDQYCRIFGSGAYGWIAAAKLKDFEEHLDEFEPTQAKRGVTKTLLQAVEEAKQVAAHRKDHYVETAAFDVLDRATWKHAAELGALELPTEPSEEDVRLVRQAALSWLCQVAAHPQHTYEGDVKFGEAAARVVWDLTRRRRTLLSPGYEEQLSGGPTPELAEPGGDLGSAATPAAGAASGEQPAGEATPAPASEPKEQAPSTTTKSSGQQGGKASGSKQAKKSGSKAQLGVDVKNLHAAAASPGTSRALHQLALVVPLPDTGYMDSPGDAAVQKDDRAGEEGGTAKQEELEAEGEGNQEPDTKPGEAKHAQMRYHGPLGAQAAAAQEEDPHTAQLVLHGGSIQVDLPQLLPFMKGLAADPMPPVGCGTRVSMGPQAAALLRFKEATQVHSCLARHGEIGMLARKALTEAGGGLVVPPSQWAVPPALSHQVPRTLLSEATGPDSVTWEAALEQDAEHAAAAGGGAGDGTPGSPSGRHHTPRVTEQAERRAQALQALVKRRRGQKQAEDEEEEEEPLSGGGDDDDKDEEFVGGGKKRKSRTRGGSSQRKGKRRRTGQEGQSDGGDDSDAGEEDSDEQSSGSSQEVEEEEEEDHDQQQQAHEVPMVEVKFVLYQQKVPVTEGAFQADFQRWQAQKSKDCSALPQVGPFTWQPYPIFKAVAERGGYEAVTQAGLWRQVSVEWQQGMAKARKQPSPVHIHPVHRAIEANYRKLLLGFEQHLSLKCEVETKMVAAEGEAARLASPSHHAADMSQDLGEGGRHHPVGTLTHVLKRKLSGATLPASKQRQGVKPSLAKYDLNDFDDLRGEDAPPLSPTADKDTHMASPTAQASAPPPPPPPPAPSSAPAGTGSQEGKGREQASRQVNGASHEPSKEGGAGGSTGSRGGRPSGSSSRREGSRWDDEPRPGSKFSDKPPDTSGGRPSASGAPPSGGGNRSSGNDNASRGKLVDPYLRRVIIHLPEGVAVPTAQRVVSVLMRYNASLTRENVVMGPGKADISIDLRTAEQAAELKSKLEGRAGDLFPELRLTREQRERAKVALVAPGPAQTSAALPARGPPPYSRYDPAGSSRYEAPGSRYDAPRYDSTGSDRPPPRTGSGFSGSSPRPPSSGPPPPAGRPQLAPHPAVARAGSSSGAPYQHQQPLPPPPPLAAAPAPAPAPGPGTATWPAADPRRSSGPAAAALPPPPSQATGPGPSPGLPPPPPSQPQLAPAPAPIDPRRAAAAPGGPPSQFAPPPGPPQIRQQPQFQNSGPLMMGGGSIQIAHGPPVLLQLPPGAQAIAAAAAAAAAGQAPPQQPGMMMMMPPAHHQQYQPQAMQHMGGPLPHGQQLPMSAQPQHQQYPQMQIPQLAQPAMLQNLLQNLQTLPGRLGQ